MISFSERCLREYRDTLVLNALREHRLNRRRTATALGVSLRTLLYWIQDMRGRGVSVPARNRPEAA